LPFDVETGERLNFQDIESGLWRVPVCGQKARIRIEMKGCAVGGGALDRVETGGAESAAFRVRECTRLKKDGDYPAF
jgi:hypothetical protein